MAAMTDDAAVEAIRVASFEAPKAQSHTEWARRIKAILADYAGDRARADAATIAELQAAATRSSDRLWHGRWMQAHDHDACADDAECGEGYQSWLALQ